MSDELPKKERKRSPYTGSSGVLVQFVDKGTPLDHTRERRGRPERSPSLPPLEEPKPQPNAPTEEPPAT